MKHLKSIIFPFVMLLLLVSACAPVIQDTPVENQSTAVMMDETSTPMVEKESPSEAMPETAEGTMMESPDWYDAALYNVNTGEAFTINDFKGKVVLVETMAMWCSNCKRQQLEVKSLLSEMGMRDDFIAVALDIDPNEDGETLKAYAASNGFDWVYAVSPAEISREISNLYGAQFVNPPSTPILVIDRNGEAHTLPFGIKSAKDLLAAIEPYL